MQQNYCLIFYNVPIGYNEIICFLLPRYNFVQHNHWHTGIHRLLHQYNVLDKNLRYCKGFPNKKYYNLIKAYFNKKERLKELTGKQGLLRPQECPQ